MTSPETNPASWYIIKRSDGHCDIVPGDSELANPDPSTSNTETIDSSEQWGPYDSQSEAIARRVGLIRAGKCQPV
ncbi:DDE transposase family protein [Egbenema bharatensis]|uniref:DDE transposase family protein n=1 Tax=Egbenema bharatensis TaxID=3463334 RepID=UPI003A8B0F0A